MRCGRYVTLLTKAGLQLTVSPSEDGKTVPCAQLFTRAETFLYGSYSAKIRVGSVPGTVTALFNYYNDTSEVDIEYLSAWDSPTLLYSVKPQIYLDNGTPDNSTYETQEWSGSPDAFDSEFHEWSFVWLPDTVHFGLDGDFARNLTTNVPTEPGKVALSHWSDGNQNYSLGPPTVNSTITIASLQAVYNDTNATALACEKVSSPCTITNGFLQGGTSSGGGEPVTHVNFAHLVTPAASGWLYLLVIFLWLFQAHEMK